MTLPPAGTSQKGFFSQNEYLAPLAVPTGEVANDVLGSVWIKMTFIWMSVYSQ